MAVHGPAEVVDHNGRPTSCELEGVETSKASTGSGDNGDLSREIDHAEDMAQLQRFRSVRLDRFAMSAIARSLERNPPC